MTLASRRKGPRQGRNIPVRDAGRHGMPDRGHLCSEDSTQQSQSIRYLQRRQSNARLGGRIDSAIRSRLLAHVLTRPDPERKAKQAKTAHKATGFCAKKIASTTSLFRGTGLSVRRHRLVFCCLSFGSPSRSKNIFPWLHGCMCTREQEESGLLGSWSASLSVHAGDASTVVASASLAYL